MKTGPYADSKHCVWEPRKGWAEWRSEKRLWAWLLCAVWPLCALSADPTVPPGSTMRPGQGDERDSLFPAHDEQEIFRVQCLTQCWTLHTSTESIYLTGRKSPLKASFLLNMSMFPGTLISTFKVTRSSGMVLLWNDPMSSWAEGFETARSTILGDSGNLRRWDLAGSRSLREPVRAPCLVPSLASFSHEVNSSPPPHTEQAWRSGSDETQSPKQSFSSQAVGRTVTVMHK